MCLRGKNALAYYNIVEITAVKSFNKLAPAPNLFRDVPMEQHILKSVTRCSTLVVGHKLLAMQKSIRLDLDVMSGANAPAYFPERE